MKQVLSFLIVMLLSSPGLAQQVSLVTTIQAPIEETSGLIYLNGKLISHNDSGGEAKLYEIDSVTGNITRTVVVENATNSDWEAICYDAQYIYIADIGNNNGSRTDLKIYRLSITDYFTSPNDTVSVDTINFSYSNQTDFTPSSFSTNFDAEAIISYNDSLFIFTKNWGNNWSNVYALSKNPGTYQIPKIDSINVQGLATGATVNVIANTIILSGYTFTSPFIYEISSFIGTDFSNGSTNRYDITPPANSSIQIESITHLQDNQYYLTAEAAPSGTASLYRLEALQLTNTQIENTHQVRVYPNPSSGLIQIECSDFSMVEIYDANGSLQKTSNNQSVLISDLSSGMYFLAVKNPKGNTIFTKKLFID